MPLSLPLMLSFPILISILMMIFQRHHLLMALLYLELMILSLTMLTTFSASYNNFFFLLIILTLGACEASMGLSLLVSMTRSYGSDFISSLSINKC